MIYDSDSANVLNSPKFVLIVRDKTLQNLKKQFTCSMKHVTLEENVLLETFISIAV